jgi:hypothetical protein
VEASEARMAKKYVGRPRTSSEVRALIVRMSQENFLWGAPRIHGELLKLGFVVSQATVSRYMPRQGYPVWSKYPSGAFKPLTGNTEPMIDHTSGAFRPLSGRGDAPVGYCAGTVSLRRTGVQGAWKAVGTFRPLVARYGLKNVPTPIEIIAELLACHAGAVTNLWVRA